MTDTTRNTRTLIVCFVIAIMALVPLRFYAEEEMVDNSTVLGANIVEEEVVIDEPVIEESRFSGFEAPYDQLDGATLY